MSYESAPATRLLATNCCCCGRPLGDSVSIERGIGPECARKHGYQDAQRFPDWKAYDASGSAELGYAARGCTPRDLVNALIRKVAIDPAGKTVANDIVAIDALGFSNLAARLADRVQNASTIEIATESDRYGDLLAVTAPYNAILTEKLRAIRGRRWDGERKVNLIPAILRPALEQALLETFGPSPVFVLFNEHLTVLRKS